MVELHPQEYDVELGLRFADREDALRSRLRNLDRAAVCRGRAGKCFRQIRIGRAEPVSSEVTVQYEVTYQRLPM